MKLKELLLLLLLSVAVLSLTAGGDAGTTLATPPWNHCLGMHKVTQLHLDIYSGYREKFRDPQGIFCIKLDCEDDRTTRRDDDELTVLGINRGNNTIIFNKNLFSIGIIGKGPYEPLFSSPRDLVGESGGLIFVADTGNDRIVRLNYIDDELSYEAEYRSCGEDSLAEPHGLAIGDGELYVADTGNDRIAVFDMEGNPLRFMKTMPGGLELCAPTALAIASRDDKWLYYGDRFLAVVDSSGSRLWKVPLDGSEASFTTYGYPGGEGSFNHLDIDYYGNIYLTDTANNMIHKYDRNLNYIVAVGGGENGAPSFDQPRGIAVNRRFGQIFVSERSGAQYFWVGTDVLRFEAEEIEIDSDAGMLRMEISFLLTEHSFVDIFIEDDKGGRKLDILRDYLLPCGKFHKILAVPFGDPGDIAKCMFRVVVTAKPTYSSGEYLTVRREAKFQFPARD